MVPLVKANDRTAMEPLALECAAETARVSADVIHTLLRLTSEGGRGGSLTATVSAPWVEGMENLPAKLVVLGTDYSTLSEPAMLAFHAYRGLFTLRNIPAGKYLVAVERVGSRTLYPQAISIAAGKAVAQAWELQPDPVAGNRMPNADLSLHWLSQGAPDHWRFDAPHRQWLSDNIPVTPERMYRAGWTPGTHPPEAVELQWMSHAWEAMKTPPVAIASGDPIAVPAPDGAMFVRFVVHTLDDPSIGIAGLYLTNLR
jgi:hypothetical protein